MTYVYPNGIRYTIFENGDQRNIYINGTVDILFANGTSARRTAEGAYLVVDERGFLIYQVQLSGYIKYAFLIGERCY